jgi:hypothetical protein
MTTPEVLLREVHNGYRVIFIDDNEEADMGWISKAGYSMAKAFYQLEGMKVYTERKS